MNTQYTELAGIVEQFAVSGLEMLADAAADWLAAEGAAKESAAIRLIFAIESTDGGSEYDKLYKRALELKDFMFANVTAI